MYEKIHPELMSHVEDVLLNRRPDATERMLEYAATLDPKSHPTALRKLNGQPFAPSLPPKLNPIPAGYDPVAPPEVMPPVPAYKKWVDPLKKSAAFEPLEALFRERIAFIDGAMGTMIQKYKLQVRQGEGCTLGGRGAYCCGRCPACTMSAARLIPGRARMLEALICVCPRA